MTSYVLILILSVGQGLSMTSVPFESKSRCEFEGQQFVKKYESLLSITSYQCMERR